MLLRTCYFDQHDECRAKCSYTLHMQLLCCMDRYISQKQNNHSFPNWWFSLNITSKRKLFHRPLHLILIHIQLKKKNQIMNKQKSKLISFLQAAMITLREIFLKSSAGKTDVLCVKARAGWARCIGIYGFHENCLSPVIILIGRSVEKPYPHQWQKGVYLLKMCLYSSMTLCVCISYLSVACFCVSIFAINHPSLPPLQVFIYMCGSVFDSTICNKSVPTGFCIFYLSHWLICMMQPYSSSLTSDSEACCVLCCAP